MTPRSNAAAKVAASAGDVLIDAELINDGFYFEGVDSPNGTIFPDVLLDRVMAHLTGAEFKVLAYIVRRTFGFKKDSDAISLDQICRGIRRRDGSVLDEGTGLARKTAVAAIHGLESKGIIICRRRSSPEKGNLPTSFALRFRGQAPTAPTPLGTNSHQGSNETYPGAVSTSYQGSSVFTPALDTESASQLTPVQPTVLQTMARVMEPTEDEPTGVPLAALWATASERLREQLGEVTYQAWLAPVHLVAVQDGTAVLQAPTVLNQRWVARRLQATIATQLSELYGEPLTVHVQVQGQLAI